MIPGESCSRPTLERTDYLGKLFRYFHSQVFLFRRDECFSACMLPFTYYCTTVRFPPPSEEGGNLTQQHLKLAKEFVCADNPDEVRLDRLPCGGHVVWAPRAFEKLSQLC